MPILVSDQSRHLLAELHRTTEAFRALAGPLAEAQLAWRPPGGGWSVAQVLEHLVVANGAYVEALDRRLPDAPPARGDLTWRPSLVGGWLLKAVSPEGMRRLPAPPGWRPGPAPRPGVLDAFVALQQRLGAQVERAATLDWERTRLASPVSALVRLNLGDAFAIVVAHTARHLGQARRVAAVETFPRS